MNRFALPIVLGLSISSLVGCASLEVPYIPPGHACGWDPVYGSCDSCGVCGGPCKGHTPASFIGHQLRCTSGCGEMYWGPWHDTPPDHCDPCDDCGQWVGERCCEPKLREKIWWTITGQHGLGGGGKGCTGCSGKGCDACGGMVEDAAFYESDATFLAPHEAPTPELVPDVPRGAALQPQTPTTRRFDRGVSFSLPLQLRSERLSQ